MGLFAKIKSLFTRKKSLPVLGLALGSGGAKGMAHLGALKAFEEAGLSFSVIAGSSIGAIVGALYAKGFSYADMTEIIEGLNRKEFSKNLRPFADLGFAEAFLEDFLDGEIESLPKPFAVCATDGETNECVVLKMGKCARAVCASAAIPPYFRGVEWEGKKLYDGAFSDAVPADVCKELGADFVVGIDLSAFPRSDEEKGRFSRMVDSAVNYITPVHYTDDCRTRGYQNADVMLRPNLHDYSAIDISRVGMEEMMRIGYEEAKAHIPEILKAIKEKGRGK